jgi:hypothetical protein
MGQWLQSVSNDASSATSLVSARVFPACRRSWKCKCTETILPSSTSPAVGVIPPSTTLNGVSVCPRTDQRGVASSGFCTIGAAEVAAAVLCASGTYNSATGTAPCTPAPELLRRGYRNSSATACPSGTSNATTGATSEAACVSAAPGYYDAGTGNISATPCAAGTFNSTSGSTVCTSAPEGYYDAGTADSSATACPSGTSNATTGATSEAACVSAAPGYYDAGNGNISATPCAAGTFSSTSGSTVCTSASMP